MKALFIHRSVGQNILDDTGLRQRLQGVELYDINANTQAYTDPAGRSIPSPVTIKDGSTEPESLAVFFEDSSNEEFLNSFDCIIFKSCYTANALQNDAKLQSQVAAYTDISNYIREHSKQFFITCTSPPRRSLFTNQKSAARAKEVQQWVIKCCQTLDNAKVLDIFGLLANKDGMLDKKYRRLMFFDQHPNNQGSIVIAEALRQILN